MLREVKYRKLDFWFWRENSNVYLISQWFRAHLAAFFGSENSSSIEWILLSTLYEWFSRYLFSWRREYFEGIYPFIFGKNNEFHPEKIKDDGILCRRVKALSFDQNAPIFHPKMPLGILFSHIWLAKFRSLAECILAWSLSCVRSLFFFFFLACTDIRFRIDKFILCDSAAMAI